MTDFYIRTKSNLLDYICDQTIITQKKYLKNLSRVKYKEQTCGCPTEIIYWYPLTNSYYPHTEDVDAFSRVNHLLGSKPSSESLTTVRNCDYGYVNGDSYSEKGAQLQYLTSTPISFVILGKPGIGEEEVGKLLAEYWKCVYIDPETLIREEISANTHAGQCIEFNMICGRAIGTDIIMRLLEKRLKSKSAKHRGFVICGFPLIPNDLYEEDPVSSETAVFNVREIFDEIFEATLEIGVPPLVVLPPKTSLAEIPGEQENVQGVSEIVGQPASQDVDIGSVITENVCATGSFESNIEEQLNFIFSQTSMPFIVVYVKCSNADTISKHRASRFDVDSKELIDLQREHSDKVVYTYFSRVTGTNDELPEDFIDVIKNTTIAVESSSTRLLVNLPSYFPANVSSRLERYRYSALPTIEKHILMHDTQYFIKVDGRISPVRMFSAIKTKLSTLPLQRVILPEKLLRSSEDGEGSPKENFDSDELNLEECFQRFQAKDIPSSIFKWGWSDWGTKCPVSMKEGYYKDGDPKFAVHFLNKIFFLVDEDAYMKFSRNPRPYLLPPYPKSSCKIIVMGPKCSGKTAVSKCLGYLLKGEVIDFDEFSKQCHKKKSEEIEREIRLTAEQEAIAKLNSMKREEFEMKETERKENAKLWLSRQSELLKQTIELKEYFIEEEEKEDYPLVLEMSSFPVKLSYNKRNRDLLVGSHTSVSSELQLEIERVKETVSELQQLINFDGFPGFDEIQLCQELLNNPDKLLDYLPPTLLPPATNEVEPANENDEFVKKYVVEAIENSSLSNFELAQSVIAEMLIEAIHDIESRSLEQGNNKGGWIVDGIHPNHELFDCIKECWPDEIIRLQDLAEYEFLLQRFETKGLNNFREFRKFFMKMGKPEVAWRCSSVESTVSYKMHAMQSIVEDIIDESEYIAESKGNNNEEEKDYFNLHPRRVAVEAYKNSLPKFDQDWNNLQSLLSEFKFTLTEVIVTDKSLEQLLEEIVHGMEDRYKQAAAVFTPEDREQEMADFGEMDLQGEDIGEGEEKDEREDTFSQNRRFGDTFNYCPVTFYNHWVLWKGKEEYAAKYDNKVYLMCSEEAMNAFVEHPRKYLLVNSPPESYPPPRICIVGPSGSGKTSVTNWLCKNLGLYNAAYDDLLKKAIAPKTAFELNDVLNMGIAGVLGEMVSKYLVSDEPLPEEFLNCLVLAFWFEEPVKDFGFAFDGFPKRPSDVNYITQHSAIPDIVIELSITEGDLHQRLVNKLVQKWQDPNYNKKEIDERKHKEKILAWEERRNLRFCELLEQRKKDKLEAKIEEKEDRSGRDKPPRPYLEDLTEADDEGEIAIDYTVEEADTQAILEILAEELPEPILEESNTETLEEVFERLYKELEESYSIEQDFTRVTRQQCEAQLIPWVTVDAGMSKEKVFAQVMRVVDKYKFRSNSLFERVYDISIELADKLLSVGYYFLSRFGKTCPVQVYDNVNSVQMFLPLQQKSLLFPVIHRQYIYFLANKGNRDSFKNDPLKYTTQNSTGFSLIPFKLAIIGPPKSGKTELAERFRRDLGMKVISGGQAGRYVLRYLEFSELAESMELILQSGNELTTEMLAKCVEALSFEGRSITQGFVLDGFPNCLADVRYLAQLGLVPHLVIDLQADQTEVHDFLSTDIGRKGLPVFSKKFIDHRYEEFLVKKAEFREWLHRKYQTLAKLPVKSSKWGVWTASFELATSVLSEIKRYYEFAHFDVVLKLTNMLVTPLEFIERQSIYKHYCPCCLHFEYILNSGGDPPDREGLVQFRKFYYYVCNDHIQTFIDDPEQYLPPCNQNNFPADLPQVLHISNIPENIREEGLCIVCYWENLPKNVLLIGSIEHAVLYKEQVFLFDTAQCLRAFMRQPEKYSAITIRYKTKPKGFLSYKDLPMLGLLQQYDSKLLFKAIVNTSTLRPVIPGLSPSVSAAINIGLHLKLNNPKTPEKYRPLYQAARHLFHEKRTNLIDYLAQMKQIINPYIYYEEPLPKLVDPLCKREAQASGYSSTMLTDTHQRGDEA